MVCHTCWLYLNDYGCISINKNEEKKKQYIKHTVISSSSEMKLKLDNGLLF